MHKLKEEMRTENDLKLTGKQLFEQRKLIIDDLKLDDMDNDEEFKDEERDDGDEENMSGGEEEQTVFYDKALYA